MSAGMSPAKQLGEPQSKWGRFLTRCSLPKAGSSCLDSGRARPRGDAGSPLGLSGGRACGPGAAPPRPEESLGQARAPPLTQVDDLERREEAVLRGQVLPRRLGAVVLDEGEAAGAQDMVVGARHGPVEVRQAELVVVDRAVGHAEGGPVRQAPLQQVPRQHLRGAGLRAGGGAQGPGPAQQQPQRGLVGPPQGLHGRGEPKSRPRDPWGRASGGGAARSACACALLLTPAAPPRLGLGTPSGRRARGRGESALGGLGCGACAKRPVASGGREGGATAQIRKKKNVTCGLRYHL